MEKKILHDPGDIIADQRIWYKSPDPDFIELSKKSRVKPSWLEYPYVLEGRYAESAIKPVNGYVEHMGYEPKVIGINGNQITIRVFLYADMYIISDDSEDLGFYHIDRPWMRQYYLTEETLPDNDFCFPGTFKFFVPWFIDESLAVSYHNVEDSPFLIQESGKYWFAPKKDDLFVTPHMVLFKFKKIGKHMQDDELGIPRRGNPMFDMKATVSDIMLEKIKEDYANN